MSHVFTKSLPISEITQKVVDVVAPGKSLNEFIESAGVANPNHEDVELYVIQTEDREKYFPVLKLIAEARGQHFMVSTFCQGESMRMVHEITEAELEILNKLSFMPDDFWRDICHDEPFRISMFSDVQKKKCEVVGLEWDGRSKEEAEKIVELEWGGKSREEAERIVDESNIDREDEEED